MTTKSYSDLNSYLRCAKQYYYRAIQKIQRKERDGSLHQGTMIHRLLMGGFLGMQNGQQWGFELEAQVLEDEIKERYESFPAEAIPELEMLDESLDIVRRYFEQADWEGWEILHVEEEFSVDIDGETLTFTPDLVARDPHDKVWIIDHKSTTSLPEAGVPFSSQQSLLYFAGVRAFYPEAVGFLFNYLRKKLPTQPRLNKRKTSETGLIHVNNLNAIDTEYEILLAFIRDEAPYLLDEPSHRARLAELRDQGSRFFAQSRVLASDEVLSQIVEEASWTMKNIARAETEGRFPRTLRDDGGYTSCERCEFNSICGAELLNLNTDLVLRNEYEPRDEKNPYESKDD